MNDQHTYRALPPELANEAAALLAEHMAEMDSHLPQWWHHKHNRPQIEDLTNETPTGH